MTPGSVVNRNIPDVTPIEFFACRDRASLRARLLGVGALAPTLRSQGKRALAPEEKSYFSLSAWCSLK